jgi:RNA polymerase subunit RPABC4/transcription elongation factor Spt4
MAASGQSYNQTVTLAEKPDALMQGFVSATAGTSGYTLNTAGVNSAILTRKFTPTGMVVFGIILGLFTLIGFGLLLVKTTETLSITLAEVGGATRVTISGVATPEMIARLNSVLSAVPQPALYRECPNCKEQMRRDATVCPHCRKETKAWVLDGNTWWSESTRGWHWYDVANNQWLPGSGPGLAPAEAVGTRECPSCKEPMSRIESVCPRCGSESEPWMTDESGTLVPGAPNNSR